MTDTGGRHDARTRERPRAGVRAMRRLAGAAAIAVALLVAPPALAQSPTLMQRSAVHQLRPCLHFLDAADRELIVEQFGIGGKALPSVESLAARSHVTAAALYAQELSDLRRMEAKYRSGACPVDAPLPGAAAIVARSASGATHRSPPTRTSPSSSGSSAPPANAGSIPVAAVVHGGHSGTAALLAATVASLLGARGSLGLSSSAGARTPRSRSAATLRSRTSRPPLVSGVWRPSRAVRDFGSPARKAHPCTTPHAHGATCADRC